MIEAGSIVTVYEDPVTKKKKEGDAVVIEHLLTSDAGLDLYNVSFIGDEGIVQRWVMREEIHVSAG